MTKTSGNDLLIRRGDVFWVNFDPTQGTEIKKVRPAVIISNNLFNKHLPRLIVAPITSNVEKVFEFDALLYIAEKKGKAMIDQIRSIDKSRLGKKIGSLNLDEIRALDRALKTALAIN